ncbi:MAG TPA: winged helix-turn-helix domain-containing protein [Sphingomicrobium sp.]
MKPGEIASRPDITLGPVTISPSRRRVVGPSGEVSVEPRTMQVLLLLLDAGGRVVTRNELFDECWGGAMVGDDALNRAIAKVRRIEADVAPGFFEVETIPRTGYRLVGEILTSLDRPGDAARSKSRVSRRAVIGGGAAIAIAGGAGLWWADRQKDREFDALMAEGLRKVDYRDGDASAEFKRAVELRPDDPRALGLFAYVQALRTESSASTDLPDAANIDIVQTAEEASAKALSLDPREPSALLAKVVLERSTLDFAGTEDRLRAILSTSPNHVYAMRHLWDFLQCVGRCQDALNLAERAVRLNPLAAANQFPRAQLLWIVGRTAEADRVIERARIAWPDHETVRFAQFTIRMFTGRASAALAMLDDPSQVPGFSEQLKALWRINGTALNRPTPENIAAARKASLERSKQRLGLSNSSTMVMSALGEVDAAFEILSLRYAIEPSSPASSRSRPKGSSMAWRFAPWLFTPPVANVRADPRFQYICDQIGLTEYWAKRGIKPDYQLYET